MSKKGSPKRSSKLSQPPSSSSSQISPPPFSIACCQDTRRIMLVASVCQLCVSVAIVGSGAFQTAQCDQRRVGDWSLVYGGFLVGCSSVCASAIHGRQRRALLYASAVAIVGCFAALVVDGISYFCVHLRDQANRPMTYCADHVEKMNSCLWTNDYRSGISHYIDDGKELKLAILVLLLVYMVIGVGVTATALTEGGRVDLCQFEYAIRELRVVNEEYSYGKRARRNRIVTKYLSRAKPEEEQNPANKVLRFFGFDAEPEPVPINERQVKIITPPVISSPKESKSKTSLRLTKQE